MAGQMDKTMIIVCGVVGSLGLLSAILGFSAEGTKLTFSDILMTGGGLCLYPENPAVGLGVCAAIFLVIAQITVAAVGGCCGCCKSLALPSESKRIIGVVCAVFSWIAAVIAFALYVDGAAWNASVARDTWPVCYVLKDGIFAGAAILALAATALGITSYVMLRGHPVSASASAAATGGAPKPGEQQPAGAGIAMGQPQFPPPPPPQGYSQAPPNYPQYSPPPQGYGQAPPNPQFSPPLAQGYAPNQYQQQYAPPPAAAQSYGAYPPPPAQGQGYGAPPPNQQSPPPPPPPPQGHEQV